MNNKIIAIMVLVSAVVLAQPEPGNCANKGEHRAKLMDELNLTNDQQKQIDNLRESMQLKAIDMKADVQKLEIKLESEMKADNSSKKSIMAIADKLNAKRGELQRMHISHRFDVRQLLTVEQRQIFDSRPFNRHGFKQHQNENHSQHMRKRAGGGRGIRRFR
ncbi:Spy/CpxP family protein refolding chaperone [Candidatus Neomarinimicrobiota bacterium]